MRRLLFVFICFHSLCSYPQKVEETFKSIPSICSYYGEKVPETIESYSPSDQTRDIIKNILQIVGLKPNFEVRAADIPNAAAVIYSGKRYILYNPAFVEKLNKAAGSNWASVSILAHEIGHHLNGHTLSETGSRPDIELEADEFSGFVLRKLGATLNEAQVAMKIAADVKASHTHPAKKDRLIAIANGWNTANDQVTDKNTIAKTDKKIEKPVIAPKSKKEESTVLAEKYIAYDVHFKADAEGKYYVTIRNHLVKISGEYLIVIGTLAQSNKKKYARMFYDKYYNYLYITKSGEIVNGAGKTVGTLSRHEA
jgi:hypothetical protein